MSRFKLPSLKRVILMWAPLAVVLLLSGSLYWLFHASSGAAWLWKSLAGLETVDLRSSKVSGDLSSGFVIQDMEYRSEDLDLLVRQVEVKVGPAWWPLSIRVDSLRLNNVNILTRSSAETVQAANEGRDIRNTLASIRLPVPLKISDAVLTQLSLQQNGAPPVPLVQRVSLQAALDERLVVDFLDIQAKGFETRLQGYLELNPPFNLLARAEGRLEVAGEAGDTVLDIPFNLEGSGNLDKLRLILASQKVGLELDSEIVDPVSDPIWDISAKLDQFSWQDESAGQDLLLSGFNLDSKGNISDWSFAVESGVRMADLPESLLGIWGSGSASGIEVSEASLTGSGIDLGFTGRLDWSVRTDIGLKAVIRQLDLSPLLPEWPSGKSLAGTLELNWSGTSLQIPASELTVTGTDLVLAVEADIDTQANEAHARLDWRNLSWPLTDTKPDFSSQSGQLNISGKVDDWVAKGELEVQLGDYPQGSFEAQGNGNRSSMHLVIPRGAILGGSLGGSLDVDWSQGLNWSATVLARGIDPEPLLPGWPGRLDTEVEIEVQSESQHMQIELLALSGQLRDVPISARGGLKVLGSDLDFDSLEIQTDQAVLKLNGSTAGPEGAVVAFSGFIPSSLLAGASGNLELEGRYSDYTGQPQIEFSLQALDLAWNGFGIKNLSVSTSETTTGSTLPALELDASHLVWNDVQLDKASLVFGPLGEQQELKLSLMNEDVALNGVMRLSPENRRDPLGGAWTGELAELVMDVGPAYQFELSKPAAFAWSSESALIGPLCLSENTEASLCLEFDYQSEGDWSLQTDAMAVPVNYLRDLLELDLHFEQLLDGHMEWHQPRDGPPTGGAEFRITAGRILDMLDDDLLAESNEGRFAFTLQNGNLESGDLDIEFPGVGFIDVDFKVLDIAGDGLKEVQGRAVSRLDHFKVFGQLVLPGVDAVDGKFESNIQLGGSLEDPEFDGVFKFSDGLVHYAPIGLQLEDIEFDGQVTQRDRGTFKGQFRAGEGIASLHGGFMFDDLERASLEMTLLGDQLLLVNTESLQILTEADISVALSPQRVDINGKIKIPSASLTPANLLLGEVRDSEDLVIESGGAEAHTEVAETTARTPVYGQLEVAIGDDVNLKVPGVETSINGSAIFTWSGAPVPMAEGSYILKGEVDVYGPVLRIRNGSISFPGVPADNPLLNIRAGRDIFGNTQIRSAGVQVTGRLKRPVLEAYTVPVTNEDRAWTLLITGSDFDQAQGVSGFDVGTYIAPKLYVSYGISLFDDENVISARYDIKKGFGVKVTSGQRETGLDVSYTIDR